MFRTVFYSSSFFCDPGSGCGGGPSQSGLPAEESGAEAFERRLFEGLAMTGMRNADQQSGPFLKSLSIQIDDSVFRHHIVHQMTR